MDEPKPVINAELVERRFAKLLIQHMHGEIMQALKQAGVDIEPEKADCEGDAR